MKLYWVGTRQSDIEDTGAFFDGSITIFGDNTNNNISYCASHDRINHNIDDKDCDIFFITTLERLCDTDEDIRFMFYSPILAYEYGHKISERTLCLNSYNLLKALSNKQRARFILKDVTTTIPYINLKGSECSFDSISNYFIGYDEFIIQKSISSGGEGTFHINRSTRIDFASSEEEYIISPYIKDAISVNVHIVITDDQIIYLPPSIQIITEIEKRLLYCGGDYICYKLISDEDQETIHKNALAIGDFVKRRKYRGVLGIDFILKDHHLYFVELNTRFQASSQLINKSMFPLFQTSLQEINLKAFSHNNSFNIKLFDVVYSNYIYTTSNIAAERYKRIVSSAEVCEVQSDGFYPDSTYPQQDNIYLNRFVFNRNICSISNGMVTLHPNIFFEDVKQLLLEKDTHFKENIKIALLNHGVTISESAKLLASTRGKIKEAVFDAIDGIIFGNVYVNIPCDCKFNSLSPFTIEAINDKLVILCDGTYISDIDIYFEQDALQNKVTSSGVPYNSIINLATDRIRINPAPVCYYKRCGLACKFCNLPEYNNIYTLSDIKEVIDYCLSYVDFRHFLIGGGTYSPSENSWEIISEIAAYIRGRSNKDIYLMAIPQRHNNTLDILKKSGITEVAFNLEIFDREMAKEYMPGKGMISLDQYNSALQYSVSIWGNTGRVRSLLIYGFDTDEMFTTGVEELCEKGIEPIISIFRPLLGTEFEALNPPATLKVINIYNKCKEIAEKYSLILGPDCPMCQNNTLSYTELE